MFGKFSEFSSWVIRFDRWFLERRGAQSVPTL